MMANRMARAAYPSDVSDDEWAFVAPYLTLMTEEAPQRDQSLREVFNGLRWIVRAGAAWRLMPHDLPPWHTVYQQSHRWLKAGVFETMVHDLWAVLRLAAGRTEEPSAAIFDSRTLQSTRESGPERAMPTPNHVAARKCIVPWISWGIFWQPMLPQPASKIAARCMPWRPRSKR